MTRVSPRTNFHSSKLIRCLSDWAALDAVNPGDVFAEQLSQWIHFADAITLSAVHNDNAASVVKIQPDAQIAARAAIEFDRVQAVLAESVMRSFFPSSGKSFITLPEPMLELPTDITAAYTPYRQFYEAHQREMELRIQPLKIHVRDAAATMSARLKKLAHLDATFEKILRDRENKLLSKVPVLLGNRFDQLFKEHLQRYADTEKTDNPAMWGQEGGWLSRFYNDMQMLLLAEIELRLQPTMGLIEALGKIHNE